MSAGAREVVHLLEIVPRGAGAPVAHEAEQRLRGVVRDELRPRVPATARRSRLASDRRGAGRATGRRGRRATISEGCSQNRSGALLRSVRPRPDEMLPACAWRLAASGAACPPARTLEEPSVRGLWRARGGSRRASAARPSAPRRRRPLDAEHLSPRERCGASASCSRKQVKSLRSPGRGGARAEAPRNSWASEQARASAAPCSATRGELRQLATRRRPWRTARVQIRAQRHLPIV